MTANANVRVKDRSRLGGADEAQMAALLARLTTAHACQAGREITDPAAVQVSITVSDGGRADPA